MSVGGEGPWAGVPLGPGVRLAACDPSGLAALDKPEGRQDWKLGEYKVTVQGNKVSTFKLYQMPHCCGIAISCNAFVEEQYRNKRVGSVLNNLRQEIARANGYTILICTDIAKNDHQRKLLKTNGWEDVLEFKNKRTGNTVYLAYIGL